MDGHNKEANPPAERIVQIDPTYMLNIVWDFWIEFHKTTIVSQCHKPNNTDLPQLIEQVRSNR